ncbi:MAG: hypothetical protein DWC07_02155 [Candidatus Poseidoniales archaeon]|nr:MAG: hypothetical protein DWC07_02155 [Candidatus Poseidoniales archaeon]
MRTLRTVIMGASMALPGLFLGLLIWIIAGQPADGESPLIEAVACNLIPLTSIFLGVFFGWKTGEEYSANYEPKA